MFELGFQGQFGGGFLQAPDGAIQPGAGGGGVVYAMNWAKQRPRDRSQRKDRYGLTESWKLAFPTSPGVTDPYETMKPLMPTSPIWFHPSPGERRRRGP